MSRLDVLYRGPLSSCNYGCPYCPFAKRHDSRQTLRRDAEALSRFLDWAEAQSHRSLGVFFTPWGEALIRRPYQDAIVRLSRQPHLRKVAMQTNLSAPLDWLARCDVARVGLWCTYHPGETTRERFLERCAILEAQGVSYSVGVVGLKDHAGEIEALREALPTTVYLWINAYRDRGARYYSAGEVTRLVSIDPLFERNLIGMSSRGKACATGESVIAVDGDGEARRCHFVPQRIGNIYDPDFDAALRPRPCPALSCRCHIGYAHMPELGFAETFGDGLLERRLPPAGFATGPGTSGGRLLRGRARGS